MNKEDVGVGKSIGCLLGILGLGLVVMTIAVVAVSIGVGMMMASNSIDNAVIQTQQPSLEEAVIGRFSESPFEAHERLLQQEMDLLKQVVASLDLVQDEVTAREQAAKLNEIFDQLEFVVDETEFAPRLAFEDEQKLTDDYGNDFDELQEELKDKSEQATLRSDEEPDLINALRRLEDYQSW